MEAAVGDLVLNMNVDLNFTTWLLTCNKLVNVRCFNCLDESPKTYQQFTSFSWRLLLNFTCKFFFTQIFSRFLLNSHWIVDSRGRIINHMPHCMGLMFATLRWCLHIPAAFLQGPRFVRMPWKCSSLPIHSTYYYWLVEAIHHRDGPTIICGGRAAADICRYPFFRNLGNSKWIKDAYKLLVGSFAT